MTEFHAGHVIGQLHPRLRTGDTGLRLTRSHKGPWLQLLTARGFEWTCAELQIDALPPSLEGLRIIHLSDLHLGRRWSSAYDQLIEKLHKDVPDLILITGDFIENRFDNRPALPTVQRLMAGLKSKHGIYAILGNHDQRLLRRHLVKWNVRPLDHQHHTVPVGDATIELIGAVRCRERHQLMREFKREVSHPPKPGSVRIFMAHYPDTLAAAERWQPHIFLSGHTHGGQVCLPGGIMVIKHSHLPRRFCRGFHRLGPTWMVVNRGLGFSSLPVRMFCPAEVIELRLTAGD